MTAPPKTLRVVKRWLAKAAFSKLHLAELNPYAVEARYPGEGDEANGEDALQALRITRQIRDLVRAELQQDVPTEISLEK